MEPIIEKLKSKIKYPQAQSQVQLPDKEYLCPYCGCKYLIMDYSRGEVVCPRCGVVVFERLIDFEHPEYRKVDDGEVDYSKEHYKVLPHVAFTVNGSNVIATFKSMREFEKRILKAICAIDRYAGKFNIPVHITRYAKDLVYALYRRCLSPNINHEIIALAALYMSCVIHSYVAPLSELKKILNYVSGFNSRYMFFKALCLLQKISNISVVDRVRMQVISYINQLALNICKETNRCGALIRKAVSIYEKYRRLFAGKAPRTVATICIYVAAWMEGVSVSFEALILTGYYQKRLARLILKNELHEKTTKI